MNRTTRIIIVMLLLLGTITVRDGAKPEPTDAYSKCGVHIAARWDYFDSMLLYGCLTITNRYNLDAYNLYCKPSSVGITLSDIREYEYVQWTNGVRTIVVGCRYTKGIFFVPGSASGCWVEATITPWYYQGAWRYSIGPSRRNYC
jgi:hypothetical protein